MTELELQQKVFRDIRSSIKFEISNDKTFVVAVAIHNEASKNVLTKIHCRKGLPLSGYVYDSKEDCYYIECCGYVPLGYVPVSCYQTIVGVGNWLSRCPMPETALSRYFTKNQKYDLRQFKKVYNSSEHYVNFMQIIDCLGEDDDKNI